MLYNAPLDQLPGNPNAPYTDGSPQAGIQGSIVSAASIEFDQREVVEVITRANVRGYSDFSGAACAIPNNADLTQLRKAIEGFITNWQFIIDTEVTFTVHGPGADFPDLITAFRYLGKYRITPTGHAILQMGGAASGSAASLQYVYTQMIVISHPNNDRISIFGAPMLAPVSRTDSGYAWNGSSSAQRNTDTQTNLAILRTKFATELHFSGNLGAGFFPVGGILISGKCLMHLDGLLLTSDGVSSQGSAIIFMASGSLNNLPRSIIGSSPWAYDGLACVNWKNGSGFLFEAGGIINLWGETPDYNFVTPFISIGNNTGIQLQEAGFISSMGNIIALNNVNNGMLFWPDSGTQWDGGIYVNANGGDGVYAYLCANGYTNQPLVAGSGGGIGPSHIFRNGGYGARVMMTNMQFVADFGSGGNANVGGSIAANSNAGVNCAGTSPNVAGSCTPAANTVGNGQSLITV